MKTILDFIKKDWVIKLIILVVAIGLWFYVATDQVRTDTFPGAVKIESRNLQNGMVALLSEDYAQLTLSADRNTWQSLRPDSLSVFVDLKDLGAGTHEVNVAATTNMSQVKVNSIKPKTIFVSIEPVITREMPITVVVEGKPAEGFIVSSYSANPKNVTVTGARSVIASIDQVTAQVNLSGETESFQKDVQLQAANIRENITFSPTHALIDVNITKSGQNKTVGVKPNIVGAPLDGYYVSAVTVNPATINVSGSTDNLANITNVSTESINVDGLKSNLNTTINLQLPANISASVSQVSVKITIDKITTP